MKLLTFILFVIIFFPVATGQDLIPDKKGFSGYILPELGYSNSANNLSSTYMGIKLGNKEISSLSDKPVEVWSPHVTFPFQLSYTLREGKTNIFVGNSKEDLFRSDRTNQLAIRQRFKANGIIQLGFCIENLAFKTWQNPFLINQNRSETSLLIPGICLEWLQIKGTGARISYSYKKNIIGDERSGNQLDLPIQLEGQLDRNGNIHEFEFSYDHALNENNTIRPLLVYTKADLNGYAVSFQKYLMGLCYTYSQKEYSFHVRGTYFYKEYQEDSYIFNEKGLGNGFNANFRLMYTNPWEIKLWGDEPIKLNLSGVINSYSPNISFYQKHFYALLFGIFKSW